MQPLKCTMEWWLMQRRLSTGFPLMVEEEHLAALLWCQTMLLHMVDAAKLFARLTLVVHRTLAPCCLSCLPSVRLEFHARFVLWCALAPLRIAGWCQGGADVRRTRCKRVLKPHSTRCAHYGASLKAAAAGNT